MRHLSELVLSSCLLLVSAGFVKADFISAFTFSTPSSNAFGADSTAGSAFTPTSSITINSLGVASFTFGQGPSSITVRIYADGTTSDLVSQVVLNTDPVSTDTKYIYHNIAPLILNGGTKYDIVADYALNPFPLGDNAHNSLGVFETISGSGVTFNNAVSSASGIGQHPTTDTILFFGSPLGGYFGPTFQIQAVPEPSSLLFCSVAATILAFGCWRRRKTASSHARHFNVM